MNIVPEYRVDLLTDIEMGFSQIELPVETGISIYLLHIPSCLSERYHLNKQVQIERSPALKPVSNIKWTPVIPGVSKELLSLKFLKQFGEIITAEIDTCAGIH